MADFVISKLLAQARPSGTSAVTGYTKGNKQFVTVTHIIVSNTTGSAADYSVYLDIDGTTYTEATALYFGTTLAANSSIKLDINATLDQTSGTIGIQTDTGNALTFNIFGEIKDIT